MKFLILSILCPFAIASDLKLNAHPGYDLSLHYQRAPFLPSDIADVCEKNGGKPGVIQSEHINGLIVADTPELEGLVGAQIPFFQIGLYAQDQQLKWFDDRVSSNYTNFPQGFEIPSGRVYFALDPHGTDGRQPGEWFALPAEQGSTGAICGHIY
ncbi:unnamed protein product [Bursaphelenchus xylophilus]|uniref:(pine wood nematode) hypothetical protein n=1 Tax=Bursaphelenchus xylophilus TaxID=6326 RepID=A0A1I7SEI8_BURXY|nr:unnamed protein product [Bursaphelenchus xylophilus]CAG9113550.1 unnamed protein product [Bursaphelenchus xylophilus]